MPLPSIQRLKKSTALLLAAMVLLLGWAGVSPELHAALHGDAGAACERPCGDSEREPAPHGDHFCAVHLFQVGATWFVDPPLPEPVLSQMTFPVEVSRTAPTTICPLPGNRGPPILGFAS